MKAKKRLFLFLCFTAIIVLITTNCVNNSDNYPVVIDFNQQENRESFAKMNLDSVYINLLGSEINEAEGDTFYVRWLAFNKQLADLVKSNNFDWGIEDSSVIIWNRVYCDGNGNIEYYLYNISDTTVLVERKIAFGEFIKTQLPYLKYNVQKDEKYAQCGSYRHYIY